MWVLITLDKFVQDHHFIFTESILTETRERGSTFLSITKEHGNSAMNGPVFGEISSSSFM